ncbi:MAG TPA: hypothetical protein VKD43_12310 [Xanthobacteraceae bacterium]|nr:hypothetical protein [Xanthobacteraceae bacterium]
MPALPLQQLLPHDVAPPAAASAGSGVALNARTIALPRCWLLASLAAAVSGCACGGDAGAAFVARE